MSKQISNRKEKVHQLLEQLELDLIEFTGGNLNSKKGKLPLVNSTQIKALIWNLFISKKYIHTISYSDFSLICDILFDRLQNEQKEILPKEEKG